MHVVRHQDVSVYFALVRGRSGCQACEVEAAILRIDEAGLTIVAPLDDVRRYTREMKARLTGHGTRGDTQSACPQKTAAAPCRSRARATRAETLRFSRFEIASEPPLQYGWQKVV